MGWLAAQGAIMAIGLFIGLVCSVIGLFFGHIILFDSIALGIAAGVCCNQFTAIHPALCLVIGIATLELKRNRAFTKAVSNMAIMDITDIERKRQI